VEVIHFSTNNRIGINLSVGESEKGDLLLCRTFQTSVTLLAKSSETFTLRAEERHAVMEYLSRKHERS